MKIRSDFDWVRYGIMKVILRNRDTFPLVYRAHGYIQGNSIRDPFYISTTPTDGLQWILFQGSNPHFFPGATLLPAKDMLPLDLTSFASFFLASLYFYYTTFFNKMGWHRGPSTLLHGRSFSYVSDIISKACFFCTLLQRISKKMCPTGTRTCLARPNMCLPGTGTCLAGTFFPSDGPVGNI